jgi:hypothetical protein
MERNSGMALRLHRSGNIRLGLDLVYSNFPRIQYCASLFSFTGGNSNLSRCVSYLSIFYFICSLKEAIYMPLPKKPKTATVFLIGIALVVVSNILIGIQTNGTYNASLLGVSYFVTNGGTPALVPGLPIQALYYFSEIVVMNYMYILAKRGWSWRKGPLTSGTIFLILGWASLHAITKDVFTALDGIILVLIFFSAYEYGEKSPLAPVVLWFAQLIS